MIGVAGRSVLETNSTDGRVRSYAHCHADGAKRITVVLINLHNTSVHVELPTQSTGQSTTHAQQHMLNNTTTRLWHNGVENITFILLSI